MVPRLCGALTMNEGVRTAGVKRSPLFIRIGGGLARSQHRSPLRPCKASFAALTYRSTPFHCSPELGSAALALVWGVTASSLNAGATARRSAVWGLLLCCWLIWPAKGRSRWVHDILCGWAVLWLWRCSGIPVRAIFFRLVPAGHWRWLPRVVAAPLLLACFDRWAYVDRAARPWGIPAILLCRHSAHVLCRLHDWSDLCGLETLRCRATCSRLHESGCRPARPHEILVGGFSQPPFSSGASLHMASRGSSWMLLAGLQTAHPVGLAWCLVLARWRSRSRCAISPWNPGRYEVADAVLRLLFGGLETQALPWPYVLVVLSTL